MLAIVAFAILTLSIGTMLVYGWQGWQQSTDWVEWQRDTSLAKKVLCKEIRCSNYDDIEVAENNITFLAKGVRASTGEESIQCSDGDLLHVHGDQVFTLAKGSVDRLFALKNTDTNGVGYVEVTLDYVPSFSAGTESQTLAIYPRN